VPALTSIWSRRIQSADCKFNTSNNHNHTHRPSARPRASCPTSTTANAKLGWGGVHVLRAPTYKESVRRFLSTAVREGGGGLHANSPRWRWGCAAPSLFLWQRASSKRSFCRVSFLNTITMLLPLLFLVRQAKGARGSKHTVFGVRSVGGNGKIKGAERRDVCVGGAAQTKRSRVFCEPNCKLPVLTFGPWRTGAHHTESQTRTSARSVLGGRVWSVGEG
jgi:hypothetical protein